MNNSNVNFLDTGYKFTLNIKTNEIPFPEKIVKPKFSIGFNHFKKSISQNKKILELQKIIIENIQYLETNNYLIDNLPEEINIKFSNSTLLEKLNPKHRNNLAEIELNSNTIYLSTDLMDKKLNLSLFEKKKIIKNYCLMDLEIYLLRSKQ